MKIAKALLAPLTSAALDDERRASSPASMAVDRADKPIDDGVLRLRDTLQTARQLAVPDIGARPKDGLRPELRGDGRAHGDPFGEDPMDMARSYMTPRLTVGWREGQGVYIGHAGGNLDNGQEAGLRVYLNDGQIEFYVSLDGKDALNLDLRAGNEPEPVLDMFVDTRGTEADESGDRLGAPAPSDPDDGEETTTEEADASSSTDASETDDADSTESSSETDDTSETDDASETDEADEADAPEESEASEADADAAAEADAEDASEHRRGERTERYSPFGDALPAEIQALAEPGSHRGGDPRPTPGHGCGNGDGLPELPDIGPDPDADAPTPTVEEHLRRMARPDDEVDPAACFEQDTLHDGPRNPFDVSPIVNPGPV